MGFWEIITIVIAIAVVMLIIWLRKEEKKNSLGIDNSLDIISTAASEIKRDFLPEEYEFKKGDSGVLKKIGFRTYIKIEENGENKKYVSRPNLIAPGAYVDICEADVIILPCYYTFSIMGKGSKVWQDFVIMVVPKGTVKTVKR